MKCNGGEECRVGEERLAVMEEVRRQCDGTLDLPFDGCGRGEEAGRQRLEEGIKSGCVAGQQFSGAAVKDFEDGIETTIFDLVAIPALARLNPVAENA